MLLDSKTISGRNIDSLTRSDGQKEYVLVKCENCLNIREIKYSSYLHLQYFNNNDGKTLCKSCGPKVKLGKIIEKEVIEQIIKDYREGLSMQKIARKFKKSTRKVREILSINSVKINERSPRKIGYKRCWKCGVRQEHSNFTDKGKCVSCKSKTPNLYINKEKNLNKRPIGKWVDEWYLEKYNNQNGKCLICFDTFERLFIDHCHKTGILRGLICNLCNSGIGLFLENVDIMENAIKYLQGEFDVN